MPDPNKRAHALAALRFRALGDETRLWLLELLAAGEQTVGSLMGITGLGQSLVSHHLKTLRKAGIVTTRRDGPWIHYSISQAAIGNVKLSLYELD